jgi:predicted ribosomally synthesized six-cysteine peptide SCIFF
MKHVVTITTGQGPQTTAGRGCGECQNSCQSACKTSCTVGNQACEQK